MMDCFIKIPNVTEITLKLELFTSSHKFKPSYAFEMTAAFSPPIHRKSKRAIAIPNIYFTEFQNLSKTAAKSNDFIK